MRCFVVERFLGSRWLRFFITSSTSLSVIFSKPLPFVKYCLIKPLVFSFNPPSHELFSIEDRPLIVSEKIRRCDWEIDMVIGKNHQGAFITFVDRVYKLTLIKKVASKHANVVTEATISLLQPYLDMALTITADNGKEFVGHQ
jgi:hypothetical protein